MLNNPFISRERINLITSKLHEMFIIAYYTIVSSLGWSNLSREYRYVNQIIKGILFYLCALTITPYY